MDSINIINPIVKPEGAVEISIVAVTRVPDEEDRIALMFGGPAAGSAFNVYMPHEVFDKLAVAVVRFVQNEAVKSQQEKKA